MADNSTTYTTIVDVEVTGGDKLKNLGDEAQENDAKFESLRSQIRKTTVELQSLADAGQEGSKEFQDLRTRLDDLNDAQERVSFQAGQFDDQLASLPGPLGQVGQGIQSFNEGLNRFSTGFKVAFGVVGLIVSAFLALKESLSRTEEGQKKLTQITESFTKILNGLFAVIEPIAMVLADLVIKFLSNDTVIKVLSKTVGILSGVFTGLFGTLVSVAKFIGGTLINNFKVLIGVAKGAGEVLAGVFTFDFDRIKKGATDAFKAIGDGVKNQITNFKELGKGVSKSVSDGFEAGSTAFTAGTKRLTDLEKKNNEEAKKKREEAAKAAAEARAKALQDKLKAMDAEDKLDEARLNKLKEIAFQTQKIEEENAIKQLDIQKESLLALAKTDGEKLVIEQTYQRDLTKITTEGEEDRLEIDIAFTKKTFELRKKDIDDKIKLYPKNSAEYKALQTELINLDTEYTKKSSELSKQLNEVKKKNAENFRKQLEEDIKSIEAYNNRVAEINLSAIKDESLKAEVARTQKFNKDKEALLADIEFTKLTIEEKNSVLRQLEKGLQNDLDKIKEDARVKANDKLIKEYDEQLRLLELTGQNLVLGTKAYFENRAAILDEAEKRELAKLDITEREKTAIKEKYVKLRKQLDEDEIRSYAAVASQTLSALSGVTSALASALDEEAKTSKEAFEKRKKLQKATAIMSAASGIIQILAQPSTLPSPFDFIVKGINAAALGIATAIQIKQINATQFEGGGGTPSSSVIPSASVSATPIKLPTIEQKAAPTIQGTQGGQNPTQRIAETIANRTDRVVNAMESDKGRPIKTYVVSADISSQQALDRRTNRAATFSGGTIG